MSTTYEITITADSYGNFTYSPSTLHAKIGDKVQWSSTVGPFALSFLDTTPFLGVSLSSTKNDKGDNAIDPRQIQEETIGHHHYAVAVAMSIPSRQPDRPPTMQVVLDAGCPDIVVSDDGD